MFGANYFGGPYFGQAHDGAYPGAAVVTGVGAVAAVGTVVATGAVLVGSSVRPPTFLPPRPAIPATVRLRGVRARTALGRALVIVPADIRPPGVVARSVIGSPAVTGAATVDVVGSPLAAHAGQANAFRVAPLHLARYAAAQIAATVSVSGVPTRARQGRVRVDAADEAIDLAWVELQRAAVADDEEVLLALGVFDA